MVLAQIMKNFNWRFLEVSRRLIIGVQIKIKKFSNSNQAKTRENRGNSLCECSGAVSSNPSRPNIAARRVHNSAAIKARPTASSITRIIGTAARALVDARGFRKKEHASSSHRPRPRIALARNARFAAYEARQFAVAHSIRPAVFRFEKTSHPLFSFSF